MGENLAKHSDVRSIGHEAVAGRDNALMLLIRNGDEDAFFELVARYKHLMVNYIYRMVDDYELAVDLAQEVFLRVFRHVDRYDPNLKFSTWIYRIATNLAIDTLRKRNRRGKHVSTVTTGDASNEGCADIFGRISTDDPDPETQVLQTEMNNLIMTAIQELHPEHREVFLLKEMEHMALDEISQITGTKVGTLKSRLFRARAVLKDRINGYLTGGTT